ncbi:MAG: hypothetical protein JSR76_08065 [Verrucomicrobia bacterium]|nr:hypothetical protein [Verrucomicrobiota bacterium]
MFRVEFLDGSPSRHYMPDQAFEEVLSFLDLATLKNLAQISKRSFRLLSLESAVETRIPRAFTISEGRVTDLECIARIFRITGNTRAALRIEERLTKITHQLALFATLPQASIPPHFRVIFETLLQAGRFEEAFDLASGIPVSKELIRERRRCALLQPLATALIALGRIEDAINVTKAASGHFERDVVMPVVKGLATAGSTEEALALASTLKEPEKFYPYALHNICLGLIARGELKEARHLALKISNRDTQEIVFKAIAAASVSLPTS